MTELIYAATSEDQIKILIDLGKKNFLISYYYFKTKPADKFLKFLEFSSSKKNIFILDSGAFSAWTHGEFIFLYDYIDFIKKYHSYFTHIVCLDVIDNPILSEVNHLIMLEELEDYNLTIIPVFHSGEPFSVLDYMVEKGYKYIGISPNNNWREEEKRKWLRRVFSRHDFEKLGIKTHAFGYQSIEGLKYFPLTTTDSTTWQLGAGYGRVINPVLSLRYSDKSSFAPEHIDNVPGEDPKFITNLCNDLGLTINDLKTKRSSRVIFNTEALYQLVSAEKIIPESNSIELFDEGADISFTEEKILNQLKICKKMGREYRGSFEILPPQKKNRKIKSKEEKLF